MELLTIGQAAAACGVSRDTIKRRLHAGAFPGAERGVPRGHRAPPWLIPTDDLARAGLVPSTRSDGLTEKGEPGDHATRAIEAHLHDLRLENRRLHEHINALVAALSAVGTARDCATPAASDGPACP